MSDLLANPDYAVDARHQPCPMPILMLKRVLKQIKEPNKIILVKSTDPNSQQDLIDFCKIHHLKIHKTNLENQEFHYYIEN